VNESLAIALRAAHDLVLPRRCAACCGAIEAEIAGRLCLACHEDIDARAFEAQDVCHRCARWVPAGTCPCPVRSRRFAGFAAYGPYTGALREAIHSLKFTGDAALGRELGRRLAIIAKTRWPRAKVVIPVPLHASRLLTRGYNQSAVLAREVARGLGAPLDLVSLRRQLAAAEQSGSSRDVRAQNVRGAVEGEGVAGKTVLLVDDVFTTGATVTECVRTLKAAEATRVFVLTLALADRSAG
jgi:ComF family protein